MWSLALGSLRAHWLESVLAGVIVVAAVAAAVALRSLTSLAEGQVHGLAHTLGKNMLVVPEETDLGEFYSLRYGDETMPDSFPERLRASEVGPSIDRAVALLYGNLELGATPVILLGGREYLGNDPAREWLPEGAVLGEVAAQRLGLGRADPVEIAGRHYTVRAVVHTPPEGLDTGVFTSLRSAQTIMERPGSINAMQLAGCWCETDVPALASDVEKVLPGSKAITVDGVLKAQKGSIAVVERYSGVLHAVAFLLVAGVVIVLVASQVRRRVREIGLLLAVGGRPYLVVLFFVLEAGLVGALGALGGSWLGLRVGALIAGRITEAPLPALATGSLFLVVPALAALTSVVAGLVPAARAATLDAATILRGP